MEQAGEYDGSRIVVCQKCGVTIGEYTERDGRIWLKVSPAYAVQVSNGVCLACNHPVSYYSTDKTLERLMERRQRVIKLERGE